MSRDDLDDSTDQRFPYGGAPRRAADVEPEDEQWRRQAAAQRRGRTGAPVPVAQLVGQIARAPLSSDDQYADLRTPSGQLRCMRCGKEQPPSVLALCQPLHGGRRELCARCVSLDVRAVVDQAAAAGKAYRTATRSNEREYAARTLIDLWGRHEAMAWMKAVDEKRDQAKGGSW